MLDDGVSLRQSIRDFGDLGFLKYFGIVKIFKDVQRYEKLVLHIILTLQSTNENFVGSSGI